MKSGKKLTVKEREARKQLEATRALELACKEMNRAAKKLSKLPRLQGLQEFINYLKSRQFISDDGRCGCEGTGRLLPDKGKPLRRPAAGEVNGKLVADLFKPRKIRGARTIKSPTNKAYEKLAEQVNKELGSSRRWTPEQIRGLLVPIGR